MMEIPGGMVVVVGDDPGATTVRKMSKITDIMQDFLTSDVRTKDAQEVYTMFKTAEQAKSLRSAVILRLTTHTALQTKGQIW